MAGLTGETVEPLDKGAGVLLVEDGGRFIVRPLGTTPARSRTVRAGLRWVCLLARHPVTIAIELERVAGLAGANGSGPGLSHRGAVLVVHAGSLGCGSGRRGRRGRRLGRAPGQRGSRRGRAGAGRAVLAQLDSTLTMASRSAGVTQTRYLTFTETIRAT